MKMLVAWRGIIISFEWSLLPLHLLLPFFHPLSLANVASTFFLFTDRSERDARFGRRKIPSKIHWKCGLDDQSGGWAWKITRKKKEYPYPAITSHHGRIVGRGRCV